METLRDRADETEFRMVELEGMIRENDEDGRRTDNLVNYSRRIHCGLILNGRTTGARYSHHNQL